MVYLVLDDDRIITNKFFVMFLTVEILPGYFDRLMSEDISRKLWKREARFFRDSHLIGL